MKINFTKKQYQRLIELGYLGEFIINSHRDNPDEDHFDLLQHIYSFAKEMGEEDKIELDKDFNQFFETAQFENEMLHQIDEFIENTFMDTLIDKVVLISFEQKYGKIRDTMSNEEIIAKMEEIRENAEQFLEEDGIAKALSGILAKV